TCGGRSTRAVSRTRRPITSTACSSSVSPAATPRASVRGCPTRRPSVAAARNAIPDERTGTHDDDQAETLPGHEALAQGRGRREDVRAHEGGRRGRAP